MLGAVTERPPALADLENPTGGPAPQAPTNRVLRRSAEQSSTKLVKSVAFVGLR